MSTFSNRLVALFLAFSALTVSNTSRAQVECDCSKIIGDCGGGLRLVSQRFKPANPVTRDLAEIHWVVELNAGPSPPKCALVSGSVEGAGSQGMNAYTELFGRSIYKKVVVNGVPVQVADWQSTTRESVTISYSGYHASCKVCEARDKEEEKKKKEKEKERESGGQEAAGSAADPVAAALAQQSAQTSQQMTANSARGYEPPNQLSAAERRRRSEILQRGTQQASGLARRAFSGGDSLSHSYSMSGQESGDGSDSTPCAPLEAAVRELDLTADSICGIAAREQQAAARLRSAASSCSADNQRWAADHARALETHAAEILRDSCGN